MIDEPITSKLAQLLYNVYEVPYLTCLAIQEDEEKAQKYIELTNELDCPLEAVFKALKNGAYLEIIGNKVSDNDMVYHKNISINSSEIILQRTNDSCVFIHKKLTDYKKTWWLSETKEE